MLAVKILKRLMATRINPVIIVLLGFALLILDMMLLTKTYIVVQVVLLLAGVFLLIVGLVKNIRQTIETDEMIALEMGKEVQFDITSCFDEYKRTQKSKRGNTDSMKYSTWHDNVLRDYNRYDDTTPCKKKRSISLDAVQSLKRIKRRASMLDDVYKTLLIPAELGLIASLCDSELFDGMGQIAAIIVLIAFVSFVFVVFIAKNSTIIEFVDDFCSVLHIPLEND